MQIRLRDYGVLDFDAGDARRQPPIDTTWQQVFKASFYSYFCNFAFTIAMQAFYFLAKNLYINMSNCWQTSDLSHSSCTNSLHVYVKLQPGQ